MDATRNPLPCAILGCAFQRIFGLEMADWKRAYKIDCSRLPYALGSVTATNSKPVIAPPRCAS
jgi:hypothetical protein